MAQVVKINGQRLDLDTTSDVLFHLLLGITDLEERLNSIDKRLFNLEKQLSDRSSPFRIKKR